MSEPLFDLDERLYEMYTEECRQLEARPSLHDFVIWCQEHDYNLPEIWDLRHAL